MQLGGRNCQIFAANIGLRMQVMSAPGGEVKSHAFKSQKLKVLNPPPNQWN